MSESRNWTRWIQVVHDPNSQHRGFSIEGMEFRAKFPDVVSDEMYSTIPKDVSLQKGNFWVISENELMRVCPAMERFAQGKDWFFPQEFCRSFVRPEGVVPVPTRDASPTERQEAIQIFESVKRKL